MDLLEFAMTVFLVAFFVFSGVTLILVGYSIMWKGYRSKIMTVAMYLLGLAYYSLAGVLILSLFTGG